MRGEFDEVVQIARGQHGRAARRQLLAAGIAPRHIDRWVAEGRLPVVHRGVYAVGHDAPSWRADYMAAELACGPLAAISHDAGTHVLSLRRRTTAPPVEITGDVVERAAQTADEVGALPAACQLSA